jgi:hypothetical protein
MSDILDKVTNDQDFLEKLGSKIPGISGYIERQNYRAADKLMRETIADHFEAIYKRISTLQTDLLAQGGLEYIDDVEKSALKIRTFIDKIRRATYGYAGVFDPTKVNEAELAQVYRYDALFFDLEDDVSRAIDNVAASMGTDGLPAAIRNLTGKAQDCLDAYNKRDEVMQQIAQETGE